MKKPRRGSDEPVSLRDAVDAVGRELGMPAADALSIWLRCHLPTAKVV